MVGEIINKHQQHTTTNWRVRYPPKNMSPQNSIHSGKMEQILLAYGLLKERVTAIMMLYKNKKAKVCSPDLHQTSSTLL